MEGEKGNRGLWSLNWFRGSVSTPVLWKVDSYHGVIPRRAKGANTISWRFSVVSCANMGWTSLVPHHKFSVQVRSPGVRSVSPKMFSCSFKLYVDRRSTNSEGSDLGYVKAFCSDQRFISKPTCLPSSTKYTWLFKFSPQSATARGECSPDLKIQY